MKKELKKFGLTDKQIKVYLAALQLGKASVLKIARHSGINRATAYILLGQLAKLGLVTWVRVGNVRRVRAENPRRLIQVLKEKRTYLKDKERIIKEILPELKSIYNFGAEAPEVRFYEGTEGIIEIYEDTLREGENFVAFTAVTEAQSIIDYLEAEYLPKRRERNIRVRVIAPDTKEGKEYKSKDKENLRTTKLIPHDKFPFSVEVLIYGQKLGIVSYKHKEMVGLIVESPEIYKTFKSIFELCWGKYEK